MTEPASRFQTEMATQVPITDPRDKISDRQTTQVILHVFFTLPPFLFPFAVLHPPGRTRAGLSVKRRAYALVAPTSHRSGHAGRGHMQP